MVAKKHMSYLEVPWPFFPFSTIGRPRRRDSGDVRAICATNGAFAALRGDGRVITWGCEGDGGDSSGVELQNVKEKLRFAHFLGFEVFEYLCGCCKVFNGVSILWACKVCYFLVRWFSQVFLWFSGDVLSSFAFCFSAAPRIYATPGAFAALTHEGRVVAWGDPNYGGAARGLEETEQLMGGSFWLLILGSSDFSYFFQISTTPRLLSMDLRLVGKNIISTLD